MRSPGDRPAEVAEAYVLQAVIYCLAVLKAGAPAVRMEFLFLERPDEPVVFEYRAGRPAGAAYAAGKGPRGYQGWGLPRADRAGLC